MSILKGDWVRYDGHAIRFYNMVGEVVGFTDRGLVTVSLRSRAGGIFEYGCNAVFLTRVGPAVKATEIACRALKIKGEPVA